MIRYLENEENTKNANLMKHLRYYLTKVTFNHCYHY